VSLFELDDQDPPPLPSFGCEECGGSFGHYARCSRVARARDTDPETSHAAAASLSSEKIRESQALVLGLLRADGPMTDETLVAVVEERELRLSPSGARTRRKELVDLGLVEDSGGRVRTGSGRAAIVWRAIST
jgi:hypothetical protein